MKSRSFFSIQWQCVNESINKRKKNGTVEIELCGQNTKWIWRLNCEEDEKVIMEDWRKGIAVNVWKENNEIWYI